MTSKSCKRCGKIVWGTEPCNCREFTVTDEDGEDHTIFSFDHEGAAVEYAETVANAGDELIDAGDVFVDVTDEHGDKKSFNIGAEPEIYYWARPKNEGE